MNNISTESGNYIFVKSRTGSLTLNNQFTLPLKLEQCLINSNDNYQATSNTFNSALSCLYINYMYLYSKLFLVKSNFPTNNPSYIGNGENLTETILTINSINQSSFTTLTAALTSVNFTLTNYLNNFTVSIPVTGITNPQDLAYTYLNTITSVDSGNLFPLGEITSSSGTYSVGLTGIPAIQINNSYTTVVSTIFLTPSTYTNNNGVTQLKETNNFNDLVQFSFASTASAGMDDLVDIQVTKNNYTNKNVIFCASKNQIYILTEYNNTVELVYSSNLLGYNRNIDFQDITSIVLYGDFLYIGDKHYNSIYKVDVSGFIRNNPINSNRFIVDRIIGGTGSENTQFNAPEPQFVYDNQLYVFDRNNSYIKVYDLNLNFLRSANYYNTLKNTPPITTAKPFNVAFYNGVFNIYYLSSYVTYNSYETFRVNEILVLDINNLLPLYEIKLSFNDVDETLIDFKQSKIDINTIYVATNKNLYKLFLSNFSQIGNFTQGIYNIKRLGDVNNDNLDALFVYQTYGFGFFTKFLEQTTYIDLLTENDFLIYTLNELFVNQNENQTFVVYNKTFKKLFYNFFKLLTNIKARPVYVLQTNTPFDSRTLVDIEYIGNAEFDELNAIDDKNFYVGENEIFSNSVLNRIITNFYILLERALQIISNNVTFEYNSVNLKRIGNSTTTPVSTSTVTGYPYIMTEQYNPNDYTTFNSIILTENGNGITTESYQKPTTAPQKQLIATAVVTDDAIITPTKTEYVTTSYSQIDNNTSVKSPTLNLPLINSETTGVVTYLEAVRTPTVANFTKTIVDYSKVKTTADYIEYANFCVVNAIRPLPPGNQFSVNAADVEKWNTIGVNLKPPYQYIYKIGSSRFIGEIAIEPLITEILNTLKANGEYEKYKLDEVTISPYFAPVSFGKSTVAPQLRGPIDEPFRNDPNDPRNNPVLEAIYQTRITGNVIGGRIYDAAQVTAQVAINRNNSVTIDPNLLIKPGGQGTGLDDTTELAQRRISP